MDIERKKRQQKIRLAITETIMVLSVVILVGVLFAVVTGWRLNRDFSIEQYGQVDIRSYPTGASITTDGEVQTFAFTNTSRMMTEGKHTIKLEKDGFDSWEKTVSVVPGWAIRLRYPRLFRQERKAELVANVSNIDFLTTAPNRESILYGNKKGLWKWLSVRGDDKRLSEIDLTKTVNSDIIKSIWAWGSEKILILTSDGEWMVVNLAQPKDSVKLGKYDKVLFMNGAGSKVWALKDNTLYTIEIGSNNGVRKALEGVADFEADENEVIYLSSNEQKVMFYHDDDEGSVELKTEIPENASVNLMITSYAGEKFVGVTADNYLRIYQMDNYPSYNNTDDDGIKLAVEKELNNVPEKKENTSRNGEFFVLRDGEQLVVFDAELVECSEYDYPSSEVWWLDEYMLTDVIDGALVVRDFDGANVRTLIDKGVADYPAMVTANNKWLFYVAKDDESINIMREQIN